MTLKSQLNKATKQVAKWNAEHPPGTSVRRYRLMDPLREPMEETVTDGPAWIIGDHSAVVRLKGKAGCYHLDCLEVL